MIHSLNNSLNNHDSNKEIHLQALEINEKINNLEGIGISFNSIGATFRNQEDYRMALEYFTKSKLIAEQINNKQLLTRALYNIGQCYFGLKIYDSASLYNLQTYNIANSINYSRATGAALKAMGYLEAK